VIFESKDGGRSWQRGPDSGYPLRRVSIVGGRYIGATPFDGASSNRRTNPSAPAEADRSSSQNIKTHLSAAGLRAFRWFVVFISFLALSCRVHLRIALDQMMARA